MTDEKRDRHVLAILAKRLRETDRPLTAQIVLHGGEPSSLSLGDCLEVAERIRAETEARVWERAVKTARLALREHYLAGILCDHEARTDTPSCSCSQLAIPPQPTVQAAANAYVEHVIEMMEQANRVCPTCHGSGGDAPCLYPGEDREGCMALRTRAKE